MKHALEVIGFLGILLMVLSALSLTHKLRGIIDDRIQRLKRFYGIEYPNLFISLTFRL